MLLSNPPGGCGIQCATYANGLFKIAANAMKMVLNLSADVFILLPQAICQPILVDLLQHRGVEVERGA